MQNKRTFEEFLMSLNLLNRAQSYFNRDSFFRILFIDTINLKICLDINGTPKWFEEKDFLEEKLCR